MTAVVLVPPLRRFMCPSCRATMAKRDVRVTTEMHGCLAQGGVVVPFVELLPGQNELDRSAVRHVVVERGDYVGGELGLRYHEDGRAVMAVRTERADGSNDVCVFPGTATLRGEAAREVMAG